MVKKNKADSLSTETKLRLLVETVEKSPNYIMITDCEANPIYHNTTFEKLLTAFEEEAKTPVQVYTQWSLDIMKQVGIPAAIENGVWEGDTAIVKADGTEIPLAQTIIAHFSDEGKLNYLSFIALNITERKQLEELRTKQALYDTVTGLPNRRQLLFTLRERMANLEKNKQLAILFLDLDKFKKVNDSYGHLVGDDVLKMIADRLQASVRETDFVCRYAGDEFVIILAIHRDGLEITPLIERILANVSAPLKIEDEITIQINASIGVSFYPHHAKEEFLLINLADKAMYQAKSQGTGTYKIYQ